MLAAIGSVVASETESAVGHVDGIPRFVPASPDRLRLEDDPAFMEAAVASATAEVVVRAVATDLHDYRYVSVPIVTDSGDVVATFTIATDRGALVGELNRTFWVYGIAAFSALLVVGAVAWVSVGRLLRPITLLEKTARDITETDLSRRIPIVGDDDLARLSETVNAMLDRLERAFADQRRLIDDAGHELRTPLTVMHTSLDLLEPRDSEHVQEVQALLMDEVGMMSRLVDDLVVLAKADRPEFVRWEKVSLAKLTTVVFTKAKTLGERDWVLGAKGQAPLFGDPQRLTQAWMQLVANAVRFSDPGSRVEIGSEASGEEVRLWVRDEGPGIAPEHHARVWERFHRVDDSAEGSGLGLPIVSAIAAAHGGRVELESEAGAGSLFTIVVPKDGRRS